MTQSPQGQPFPPHLQAIQIAQQISQDENLLKRVADKAVTLLSDLLKKDIPTQLEAQHRAALNALEIHMQRAQAAASNLEALLQRSRSASGSLEADVRNAKGELTELSTAHKAMIAKELEDHREFVTGKREEFVRDFLKEVAGTTDQKQHWSTQESQHRKMAIWMGTLLTLLLVGLFCTALVHAASLTIDLEHIGAGVSVVACGLIGAWGVGILSRILMSNLFSLKDARHRIAVIDTFVGMRFRQQLDQEDAKRLFAFLLAPSKSGLLKGAEQPPIIEAILGLTKTKKEDAATHID